MTQTKRNEALLTYIEFHLIKMVEKYEHHINDPDIISDMYDNAYSVLCDIERTLDAQRVIDIIAETPPS